MYLIESYYRSPLYITMPKPVGYVKTLAEAKRIVEQKNANAVRNQYAYTKLRELK